MGILILLFAMLRWQDNYDVWTFTNANYKIRNEIFNKYKNDKLESWSNLNIECGDIVFRSGQEVLLSTFNFSKYVCNITRSEYSHCGISWKIINDVYIIDMDRSGTRKIPFSLWMNECDNKKIKVMRLKKQYEESLVPAQLFIWNQYVNNTPFDYDFNLGPDKLYCAELVYNTFKAGRICLTQPIKAANLPGISDHPYQNVLVILGSRFYCDKPFNFEKKLITAQGISESKYLYQVFEGIIP